jgi:hypothetical protein
VFTFHASCQIFQRQKCFWPAQFSQPSFNTPLCLLPYQLPTFPPVISWPNAIPPRPQNPIRIKRILNSFIKPSQRPITPITSPTHLIRKQQMRPILTEFLFRRPVNHLPHQSPRSAFLVLVCTVIHNVGYVVHFSSSDAESGEGIEAVLGV